MCFWKKNKPPSKAQCQCIFCQPEVQRRFNVLTPFLLTGLIAWPSYWLGRGLIWHQFKRRKSPIQSYITKTYHEAKLIEMIILGAGLASVFSKEIQDTVNKIDKNLAKKSKK